MKNWEISRYSFKKGSFYQKLCNKFRDYSIFLQVSWLFGLCFIISKAIKASILLFVYRIIIFIKMLSALTRYTKTLVLSWHHLLLLMLRGVKPFILHTIVIHTRASNTETTIIYVSHISLYWILMTFSHFLTFWKLEEKK